MQVVFRIFILLTFLISVGTQAVYSQEAELQETETQGNSLNGTIFCIKEFTYNADNKFGEDVKTSLRFSDSLYFNDLGKVWKYSSRKYDNNEWVFSSYYYVYNAKGDVTLKKYTTSSEYIEYEYFTDGKLKEVNIYNEYGGLKNKHKYQYSDNETICHNYGGSGGLISVITISDNGRKKVVESGIMTMKEKYDDHGRLLESLIFMNANNGVASSESYYKYNSHGNLEAVSSNLSAIINWSPESHDVGLYYTYEYDQHGNWIVCKEYQDGEIVSWSERDITYAESLSDITEMMVSEENRIKEERRAAFVRDSLAKREAFIKDSLAKRKQFIQDSLAKREIYVRDSTIRRTQFVMDSLRKVAEAEEEQKQLFKDWLSNIGNKCVNYNRGRNSLLYSLTGESEQLPWILKTKNGNIKKMEIENNRFTFVFDDKTIVSDIAFEYYVRVPFGPSGDNRITALFTEDRTSILIFLEEPDSNTGGLFYNCKLACFATQSENYSDTKLYSFSSKYQKEVIRYYNQTDIERTFKPF